MSSFVKWRYCLSCRRVVKIRRDVFSGTESQPRAASAVFVSGDALVESIPAVEGRERDCSLRGPLQASHHADEGPRGLQGR